MSRDAGEGRALSRVVRMDGCFGSVRCVVVMSAIGILLPFSGMKVDVRGTVLCYVKARRKTVAGRDKCAWKVRRGF